MGRLSDMYGGKLLFVIGVGWLGIWSVVAGLSQGKMMIIIGRALQGLGPAAFLPSSVMLLGSVYRPGPRKNLVSSSLFSRKLSVATIGANNRLRYSQSMVHVLP